MFTKEQRDEILRIASRIEHASTEESEAYELANFHKYLDSITMPEGWQVVPTTVLQSALRALEESVDLVQDKYDTNWRNGLPTRKGQLNAMLLELVNHIDAIELLKKFAGGSNE